MTRGRAVGLKNSLFVRPSSLHDNDPICSMLIQYAGDCIRPRAYDKHGLYYVLDAGKQWLSIGGFKHVKITKITHDVFPVKCFLKLSLNFESAQVRPESARRF